MFHRKSTVWIIFGIIFLLGVCCLASYQVVFKHCLFWTCAPHRDFSVLDLEIPSGYFPEGSVVDEMDHSSELNGAIELGHMDVFWRKGQGAAHYTVWRFGTERKAITFFDEIDAMEKEFGLIACSDLSNITLATNENSLTCGRHKFGGYRADLNARYEEYVIGFNVTLDDEMTLDDFKQIIAFIDDLMSERLDIR